MSTIGKALAVIGTLLLAEFGLVAPVAGQTKVSIDGTDITITVPIDGVGIDKKTAAEWKHGAESLWNAAFNAADNPFKGCLTLKLVVDVQAHDLQLSGPTGPPHDLPNPRHDLQPGCGNDRRQRRSL